MSKKEKPAEVSTMEVKIDASAVKESLDQAQALLTEADEALVAAEKKLEETRAEMNELLVAVRGGGDMRPAVAKGQDFLDGKTWDPAKWHAQEAEKKKAEKKAAAG